MDARYEAERIRSAGQEKELELERRQRDIFRAYRKVRRMADEEAPVPSAGDSDLRFHEQFTRQQLIAFAVMEEVRGPDLPWPWEEKRFCEEHRPPERCYECAKALPRGRRASLFEDCAESSSKETGGEDADE